MMRPHIAFEWNAAKAASNLKKHGVSFAEAVTAFADESALVIDNPEHSDDEPRQTLIGYSDRNRLVFVSFTWRADNLIRLNRKARRNPYAGRVKFTHGGKRNGAGRKPAPERIERHTITLYPTHTKYLRTLDTNLSRAIRKLIAKVQ